MKKLFAGILVVGLLLIYSTNAQPKLELIGGDTHNWGNVKPKDSPLKTTIKIINAGKEKLIINNVRTSCGCTAVLLDTNQLEPGQFANIDVKLNVPTNPGHIEKMIYITSNDPVNKTINYYIKADVFVDLEFKPNPYFNFADMTLGVESVCKVKMINHTNKSIIFTDFTKKPDYMKFNLPDTLVLKPNQDFEIEAKVTPVNKGYFGSSLKFKSSNPDYPVIDLPGSSVVKDPNAKK